MNRSGIILGISFFLFFIFQVMLFKKLVLFNTSFCFIYVAFILLLPVETNPLVLMLAAFGLGLLVDIFYDYQGMHAAATVAVAYVRNYWLTTITPQGGYDLGAIPTLGANGFAWFITYAIPLVLLHHLILFLIDADGFNLFGITIIKVLSSVLFTMMVLLLHQYIFFQRSR
jgi:hypothetical protein